MIADSTLTSEAPYSNFNPKRATTLPCFSFNPFTAPTIVPIEPKLAKDMRKTETMAAVRSLKLSWILTKSSMATNSYLNSLSTFSPYPSFTKRNIHRLLYVPFRLYFIYVFNTFSMSVLSLLISTAGTG